MRCSRLWPHSRRILPDTYFKVTILLPAIVLCASVLLYPSFLAVRSSLVSPGGGPILHNYSRLLTDKLFLDSLVRTCVFAGIAVSLEFSIGLGIALLLAAPIRWRGFFRMSLLVPWVLPPAAIAFAWRWIFYDHGILNDLAMRIGLVHGSIPFLWNPHWAFATIIVADTWKTAPFVGIILLAGLSVIPEELYEAAAIDGASPVRRFFLITLPLLTPYILTALLFRFVQTIGIFDLVWILTGGGPSSSTEMLSLYITKQTFRFLNIGYGASLSIAMFIIAALTAVTVSFFARRRF